jgi:Uma2 family endonuclease
MATATKTEKWQPQLPSDWSLADLRNHLGGIPLKRIRLFPPPGLATEEDVIELNDHDDRLCELDDGVLVEKTMGWYESLLAMLIGTELNIFLRRHRLGTVVGEAGPYRILPGLIKIPDVSFVSWARLPKKKRTLDPIPAIVPDLAVEVLSKGNTRREMQRKLRQYFDAGVRLVWYIDPKTRSAHAYTSSDDVQNVGEDGVLDGGDVLPRFQLSLSSLFEEADRQESGRE